MKLKIEIYESEDACPLYFMQQGEESKAYLYADLRSGKVYVDSEAGHVNSITEDEQNGYLLSFRISNNLTEFGINKLLSDSQVLEYLETIEDNSEEEYRHGNYICILTEAGQDAHASLERYLEKAMGHELYESLRICSAYDFFEGRKYPTLVLQDEPHEDASLRLRVSAALSDQVYLSARETEIMLDNMKDELLENAEFATEERNIEESVDTFKALV